MPGGKTGDSSESDRQSFRNRLKRATFAVLFSAILLIPRVRRLRKRVFAWTLIRACAAVAAAWLAWQFVRGTSAIPSLVFAIGLVLFALIVRARPERRSVDDVAREMNALVVLNGGSWINGNQSKAATEARICVGSDRLVVLAPKLRQVAEIPLASVRQVNTHSVLPGSMPKNGARAAVPWQMEVIWSLGVENRTSTFRFEGFFAEHLARVAEQTIASVWKKQLPVLRS